ncbi:hypothetical protein [Photorhabdus akhurstii]|uniref:hypothetical protein n=1 Tax=Photorhabdus akhurstii TaxID=171438 RepID=UPI0037043ABD
MPGFGVKATGIGVHRADKPLYQIALRRVIGHTEGHAARTVFSHIRQLHRGER